MFSSPKDDKKIKNNFNKEALNERFVVVLSSLASNIGQAVSVSSLLSFVGTSKNKDIDLREMKSGAEQCGFTIYTESVNRGLKDFKLEEKEASILLLNSSKGLDFVYVYNPQTQPQQSMEDMLGGGMPNAGVPGVDEEDKPEMFNYDELGDGVKTPRDLNDLYWQGQAPSSGMNYSFSSFFFKQVFDVVKYIFTETKDGFVNIVNTLLMPFGFVRSRYCTWRDYLRRSFRSSLINYVKKCENESAQGFIFKLFTIFHIIFKPMSRALLPMIGGDRKPVSMPRRVDGATFAELTKKDLERLKGYKYYRVSSGVIYEVKVDIESLNKIFSAIIVKAEKLKQTESDSYTSLFHRVSKNNWLYSLVQKQKPIYMRMIMATVIINIFAVVGSLYTMTVYDRIIPNNALETLWTLSIGMLIMHVFDYILKLARTALMDKVGANINLSASRDLFNQLIGVRMQFLKGSTGHIATIMRDFTKVSEFFTSATLLTLVELPFFFVYLFVMSQINVSVMLVLLAVAIIVILLGFFTLPMLNAAVKEATVDEHEHQGTLVEIIGALETIKGTGGARLMNQRFYEITVASTYSNKRVKFLSQIITYTMGFMQQMSSVIVVVIGVYAISTQQMTVGGLIASSILLGRAMAPVTQFAGILTRIHQVRSSMSSLDGFMMTPTERESHRRLLSVPKLNGNIEVRNVSFKYDLQNGEDILTGINIKIKPGEKIAILGRIGSGKSTLVKSMFGINIPTTGHILYNGIDYRQIESSDLRARIGYVPQDPVLISGTLIENLTLGNPYATDKEIIKVCKELGIDKIAANLKDGYNYKLRERGIGLSVGQRQLFSVAQALLKKPDIIIMDEPTSALDDYSVRAVRGALDKLPKETTLVLVAHSQAILSVVDRLIILEDGKLIADGPKEDVIAAINAGEINPR
ncbi:MAG: ATP-binding cassette domain-containing protein [Alphaproteobacteria bacterium]